jgi:hypothetical protein
MDISGGGTANTVPWGGITNLPDAFKQEPLSANASFDNAYNKVGIVGLSFRLL